VTASLSNVPDDIPDTTSKSVALRRLTELVRPVALAGQRTLPVAEPLAGLLPDGALTRGSMLQVVGVGATSLALALVAAASQDGSWSAIIGLPELGLVAAEEHGIALARLALIEVPRWRRAAELVAAVIDGIDLVLLDARVPLRAIEVRRITARLREQGAVLLMVEPGLPGESGSQSALTQAAGGWSPDVVLTSTLPSYSVSGHSVSGWSGLGHGHGVLRQRRVIVDATGRGRSSRPRRLELLLPDVHGVVDRWTNVPSSPGPSSHGPSSLGPSSHAYASTDASSFLRRGPRVAG
jgi:hypothetical protein